MTMDTPIQAKSEASVPEPIAPVSRPLEPTQPSPIRVETLRQSIQEQQPPQYNENEENKRWELESLVVEICQQFQQAIYEDMSLIKFSVNNLTQRLTQVEGKLNMWEQWFNMNGEESPMEQHEATSNNDFGQQSNTQPTNQDDDNWPNENDSRAGMPHSQGTQRIFNPMESNQETQMTTMHMRSNVSQKLQFETPNIQRTPTWTESPTFNVGGIQVDVSPDKHATGDYFGNVSGTPISTHGGILVKQASPNDSVRIEAVKTNPNVNVTSSTPLIQPTTMVTGTTPAILALQQSAKIPHFNGDDRRWTDFVRDWTRYSAYSLLNAPDGPMGDILKRDLLVNCLDGVLKKQFDSMIMRQPHTTFQDVWQHLEHRYQVDDPHRWRKEWAAVQLTTRGERIFLRDLHFFESAFETAKSMVSDWTAQEEIDLILKQLPDTWRTKVLRKEASERRNTFVVKLSNLPQGCDIKQILQQLHMNPLTILQLSGCTHVSFKTEAERDALMKMNLKLNGHKVTCVPIRDRWTGQDIFIPVRRTED